MMARATRSSTSDAKRKRADPEPAVDGRPVLPILEAEDSLGLLDRIVPDQSVSIRVLLSSPSPLSLLTAAIHHLRPLSDVPRARLSPTAAEQARFCALALSLLDQLAPAPDLLQQPAALPSPPSSPPRPPPKLALVQHLPSGDYWSSLAQGSAIPDGLSTANAELVAVLPTPSTSDAPVPTLGSYSKKPAAPKKPVLPQPRSVTTGVFLDYGPFASFAPSFDQDGELVGRNQLGQVLWHREEKLRLREALARERLEGTGSIVQVSQEEDHPTNEPEAQPPPDIELDGLLPPEDISAINAALNDHQLEKAVQDLLERNQRALQRLEELQFQRLTKHPTSTAEEGSEEWDTAQAILDSLTLLTSLRPRSSSQDEPAIVPPPSVLHKLHRTLATEPSPGWYGTLPAGRTTALRDDSTVKVKPGVAATPAPATTTATTTATPATPTAVAATSFAAYPYTYNTQQQAYRQPQAAAYAYKPGQAQSYYQTYGMAATGVQQQQSYYPQAYATGTSNQQPYGATAATSQQPYPGGYPWFTQYPAALQTGAGGSGRGTPQPVPTTPTTYTAFFGGTTATAATPAANTRTPAIANTVATSAYAQTAGVVPTYVRSAATTNGSPAPYFSPFPVPTQPAR